MRDGNWKCTGTTIVRTEDVSRKPLAVCSSLSAVVTRSVPINIDRRALTTG